MVADGAPNATYQTRPMARLGCCQSVFNVGKMMNRKKKLNAELFQTRLKRCLNTFDICLLGVGHMIGAGIYVLAGQVAKEKAGPSVLVSFLVAGFVSLLAALCYAEFGARVPKAGSAYVYTYVTMGEFWAFVIGWDVILENMIGAASVARAWSSYLDGLFHQKIQNGTLTYIGTMHLDYFSEYPDFLAFGFCLVVCAALSIGVKGSSIFNSIFTLLNLAMVTFVVCVGFYYANGDNWKTPAGFFVNGFHGVITGAATCFYAFVGFDSIATSSEEARNPGRSIPLATFLAMAIATVAYVLMSSILTLMIPYNEINTSSAFPDAFNFNGAGWASTVVTIGALAGMTTTMFGGLFSLPRCVYSMATDGLLFKCFAYVHPKTQTPIITLLVCSLLTATISLLFDINKLVDFMSIGTLMAYTIVSVSVIVLRYQPPSRNDDGNPNSDQLNQSGFDINKQDFPMDFNNGGRVKPRFTFLRFMNDDRPGRIPTWATLIMTVFIVALCALLQFGIADLAALSCWSIVLLVVLTAAILLCLLIIAVFDQNSEKLIFTVPMVPVLPAISVFCNVYLMLNLEWTAWLRFAVWMVLGMSIYFFYGIRHSKENVTANSLSTIQLVPPPYPISTIDNSFHNEKSKGPIEEHLTKL